MAMVLVYISIGIALLFTSALLQIVPIYRVQLGTVFICYGLYRGYVSYVKLKKGDQ